MKRLSISHTVRRITTLLCVGLMLGSFGTRAMAAMTGCTGSSACVAPTQSQAEALFARIEDRYRTFFSPTSPTKILQSGNDTAIYRTYPNAGLATYLGALWYANGNVWIRYSSLDEGNRQFCNSVCWNGATDTPAYTILLGSPTATSIKANIFSESHGGTATLKFGTVPGAYDKQTAAATLAAGQASVMSMDGLTADTRYYYRLYLKTADGTTTPSDEHTFHTARPTGSSFSFTIQADSHLDENSDLDTYRQTLANVLTDQPDFHIDLGDTFMSEKHTAPFIAAVEMAPDEATVIERYQYERGNFGLVSHSAPLFLVNGNHEGELGWLADGTAQNIAIWTTRAREQYYANPTPDGFYTGDLQQEPFVGERGSWYSWHWGNALFVVLDPYWYTKTKTNTDGWVYTLGERQYQWLQQTLSSSQATFKFVFIHNLVGGLDGQMRGGIEAAPYFEWGGRNLDGTSSFSQKRPGWSKPIHDLMVQHRVTAVFHGHDHLYAKQDLDGIVYQEVPQPSAKNFSSGAILATEYHYKAGTLLSSSGHLRVTVSPGQVTAEYVRSWLPKNETTQRKNGQIDDRWTVVAH